MTRDETLTAEEVEGKYRLKQEAEELEKEAENFIIDRYKLNECYREDNAETREYMRMDVHFQYEEEYQLYLDATKELQKENAELKEKNKWYSEQVCNKECAEVWGLLTKAKELLKEFVHHYKAKTIYVENMQDLLKQSEQFLSEVKK